MEHDELFNAKLDFLAERFTELMNHRIAFSHSARDSEPFPEPLGKMLHSDELKGFSPLLEALNAHADGKEDFKRGFFKKLANRLMSDSIPDIELLRDPLIDPGYAFADEWDASNDEEIGFAAEFYAVLCFFLKSEGADPQVDFALTKTLFQLGKVIGRLERDGPTNKDRTSRAGSTHHKSKVPHEEVIQEAKEVSKRIESVRNIARIVRTRLRKKEAEKEKPMEVYSEDRIRKIWIEYKKDIG